MNATISGVTCGNCTKRTGQTVKHASVDDVRACYAGRYAPQPVPAPQAAPEPDWFAAEHEMNQAVQAAERAEDERVAQFKSARDVGLSRRVVGVPDAVYRAGFGQHMTEQDEAAAARSQDPWREVRALQAQLPHVEHMRYAIEQDGVWKFYQVDKPKRGRWAGRTFVNVMASDDTHPVRSPQSLITILSAILRDVEQAVSDYGHQIGKCGICHRTLTDNESIARGIGPICAGKVGW